jgi:hypothetical protein
MAEMLIKQLLSERSPEQCTCLPLKIANFAIASAADRAGADLDTVARMHESLIDRDCPGMVEIKNGCSRDGCMPDRECGHRNGPKYLYEAASSIEF